MFTYLIKYFRNFVNFYAEGAETEKLLNFCSSKGIDIYDPQKTEFRLYAKIPAKDYNKLRTAARKYGLTIRIIRKRGLYYSLKKNRNKTGIFLGMVFALSFIISLQFFIWEINIIGNDRIKSEDILVSAEKMGLVTGTLSGKHEVQDIEWYIMRNNKGLASVEINIQGSVANILVNEIKDIPEMISDDDFPVNIIASRYGVIEEINVFDGHPKVAKGDGVMKGDLLVSAVYEDRYNKLTLKHARAEIIAKTDYSLEIRFPMNNVVKEKGTLNKKIYRIIFPGFDINLGKLKNTEKYFIEEKEKHLSFFWIKLPIKLIITEYFDVKEYTITYNLEESENFAFAMLKDREVSEMKEMKILSRKTEEKIKDGEYIIKANYIVLMDIGEEQPIESDVPWENTDDIS